MQLVAGQQFWSWFTGIVQAGWPDIGVDGFGVFCAGCRDQCIGFDNGVLQVPAFQAGFDGDEYHAFALRNLIVDFLHETLKVAEHNFGGFAGVDVVIPGVQDNHAGAGSCDQTIEVVDRIIELGSAEAVIDSIQIRKGLRQIPQSDTGAADEDDIGVW